MQHQQVALLGHNQWKTQLRLPRNGSQNKAKQEEARGGTLTRPYTPIFKHYVHPRLLPVCGRVCKLVTGSAFPQSLLSEVGAAALLSLLSLSPRSPCRSMHR